MEKKIKSPENFPANENWKGNKYAERLISEWLKYKKIMLSVDFDDTLAPWGFTKEEDLLMFDKTIKIILLAKKIGAYVTIFTACSSDRYNHIVDYCLSKDLKIDSINENPIEVPFGKERKIYYNWNLCDRSGLEQALSILEYACYRVSTENKSSSQINFDI